jgi:hypothetical protein
MNSDGRENKVRYPEKQEIVSSRQRIILGIHSSCVGYNILLLLYSTFSAAHELEYVPKYARASGTSLIRGEITTACSSSTTVLDISKSDAWKPDVCDVASGVDPAAGC